MAHRQRAATRVLLTCGSSFHRNTRSGKAKPLIPPAAPTPEYWWNEAKRAAIDALGSDKAVFIRLKGPVTRISQQTPAGEGTYPFSKLLSNIYLGLFFLSNFWNPPNGYPDTPKNESRQRQSFTVIQKYFFFLLWQIRTKTWHKMHFVENNTEQACLCCSKKKQKKTNAT